MVAKNGLFLNPCPDYNAENQPIPVEIIPQAGLGTKSHFTVPNLISFLYTPANTKSLAATPFNKTRILF